MSFPTLVKGPDGKTYINPAKDIDRPFALQPTTTPFTIPAGAGTGQSIQNLVVPAEENLQGDFEGAKIMAVSDGPFQVDLWHTGIGRILNNQPIHSSTIAGTAQLPFNMFESVFIEAAANLRCNFTNLASYANSVYFTLVGRRFLNYRGSGPSKADILEAFLQRRSHPYWATTDNTVALTAGQARATAFITIQGDSDFEVAQILAQSDYPFTFQIFEGSTGRPLMADLEHRDNFAGNAQFPFVLPSTWLAKRQTRLRVVMTNLDSNNANNVYLTLHGRLLYQSVLNDTGIKPFARHSTAPLVVATR